MKGWAMELDDTVTETLANYADGSISYETAIDVLTNWCGMSTEEAARELEMGPEEESRHGYGA